MRATSRASPLPWRRTWALRTRPTWSADSGRGEPPAYRSRSRDGRRPGIALRLAGRTHWVSDLLRILAVLGLVGGNAFFVIGEYSVVTARRSALAARAE